MAAKEMREVLKDLCETLLRDGSGRTDSELLDAFVRFRDEAAFPALVRRHGPMVWGVCRRILLHHQDAEDAFQATFLVLVRKAATIAHKELLANWLYGVAQQTAIKARAVAARRSARERQVSEMPEPGVADQELWNDLSPIIDQELSNLPDKYRILILLCDLQSKTRKEVARQLGCPEGTVAGRLARARTMLAQRLGRHRLTISGGALATMLSQQAASASVPAPIVSSTITAASLLAAGQAVTGVVSPAVTPLMEGVLKAMLHSKLKTAMGLMLTLAACTCMVLAAAQPPGKGQPADPRAPAAASGLEAWWNDLASTDEAKASRALLAFAAKGKESTAFFRERLRPVKADLDTIKKLITQLDENRFAVREAAFKKLTVEVDYLGKSARPILEQALKGDVSAEVKKSLGKLLELVSSDSKTPAAPPMPPVLAGKSISVSSGPGGIKIIVDGQPLDLAAMAKPVVVAPRVNTQWLRATRTVAILEMFGTPEARALLEALAGGEQDTVPTQEAKAALERLGKSK